MTLDMEVRSSGAGPRHRWHGSTRNWHFRWTWIASGVIAEMWTRWGRDHRGRERLLADGVAIIIRRAK